MQYKSDLIEKRRLSYAYRIAALAGSDGGSDIARAITAAFGIDPSETFVGQPPWRIISPEGRSEGVSEDPIDIHQDVLVALDTGKGLNNGQPSLHAFCLNALARRNGDGTVHVGAGTGYYPAVLAELVGNSGGVDAYEIVPDLARTAAKNLAGYPNVQTHGCSVAEAPLPECDVLYVSAACAE